MGRGREKRVVEVIREDGLCAGRLSPSFRDAAQRAPSLTLGPRNDDGGEAEPRHGLMRRYGLACFQKLPSCLVGIEACASSHHWSRELQALGHTVRLMPPAYVKPYVERQKN